MSTLKGFEKMDTTPIGVPRVTIYPKYGRIVFNSAVVRSMNIKPGMKGTFYSNTDTGEFVFKVESDGHKRVLSMGRSVGISSKKIVSEVLEVCGPKLDCEVRDDSTIAFFRAKG